MKVYHVFSNLATKSAIVQGYLVFGFSVHFITNVDIYSRLVGRVERTRNPTYSASLVVVLSKPEPLLVRATSGHDLYSSAF